MTFFFRSFFKRQKKALVSAKIDEASDDSFPASDPPAWTGVAATVAVPVEKLDKKPSPGHISLLQNIFETKGKKR